MRKKGFKEDYLPCEIGLKALILLNARMNCDIAKYELAAVQGKEVKVKENAMDEIITQMMEYVCDQLCKKKEEVSSEDEMEDICAGCDMGDFVCKILNTYNNLNKFDNTQSGILMKKYAGIVMCSECEYRAVENSTDTVWCRLSGGLDESLKNDDGCSRGKVKDD